MWILHLENLPAVIGQVLAELIAQVCVCIPVADHFDGCIDPYGAMVGGKHYLIALSGNTTEYIDSRRMAEPRLGEISVGGIGGGKLAYHLRLGARM